MRSLLSICAAVFLLVLFTSFAVRPAEGSDLFPFACDGNSHTYTFTANGNDGGTAQESVTIGQQ